MASLSPPKDSHGSIRVLIADDSPMRCQLLQNALVQSGHDFSVAACAVTCLDVVNCLNASQVDVALLGEDLKDGRCSGFRALREVYASHPETSGILLCNSLEDDLVIDAFRVGAKGVFCRAEPFETLCKCIQAVHRGQIWANSVQLQLILSAFVKASPLRVVSAQRLNLLAKREAQVATLVADGLTNREVALKLSISKHTVRNYLFHIYNKLGISSRVELVLYITRPREEERYTGRTEGEKARRKESSGSLPEPWLR